MKKCLFSLCSAVLIAFTASAAQSVTAYLTYAAFNLPVKGPYIETYLSVIGSSVKFVKNANGKFQGAVDIGITFTQNNEIKSAQKYTLNSQEMADTSKGGPNFIDLQRYVLANGTYSMEISIADKNKSEAKPFVSVVPVTINFTDDRVMISDIQLLESFVKSAVPSVLTKSGYDLVPYVSTYYPENCTIIKFYAEIYNSKKIIGEGQKLVMNYFIESDGKKVKLSDYSAFSKQTAAEVNTLLAEFNIEALPSGNYYLVIEVRDKENKIQAEQKCFIQRKNSHGRLSLEDLKSVNVTNTFVSFYKSVDTLSDYIRMLRPISSSSEVLYAENQLKSKNLEMMQQFFYTFWKSRSETNAQLMWFEYYKEVMKVNKVFGTHSLKGYESDRGRVYLQYGPPTSRDKVDLDERNSKPYEIWQYDKLSDKSKVLTNPSNSQSNKKFVFVNSDLITNTFKLIHSTALGEIYNDSWQSQAGDNAQDNFDNPR